MLPSLLWMDWACVDIRVRMEMSAIKAKSRAQIADIPGPFLNAESGMHKSQ